MNSNSPWQPRNRIGEFLDSQPANIYWRDEFPDLSEASIASRFDPRPIGTKQHPDLVEVAGFRLGDAVVAVVDVGSGRRTRITGRIGGFIPKEGSGPDTLEFFANVVLDKALQLQHSRAVTRFLPLDQLQKLS